MTEPVLTVCPECNYPHEGQTCPNPACPANPSLSPETLELIFTRRKAAEIEREEREFRFRMWELSFKSR